MSVITGGVTSLTVTVKLQLDEFPAASVAVACTVVVPTGKLDPDAWSVTIEGAAQLSLPPTVNVTGAAQVPAMASATMFDGQLIVGGVLSITVTVKLQVGPAVLVHCTGVEPTAKKDPEG